MALNRKPTRLTIDLSTVVQNAASSVREARSEFEAKQELEFQKAIADGMSYEDQIKFRQKQVQELKESPFYSVGQEKNLETSVTETKKLARFKRYRDKYDNTIGDIASGIRNNEEQLMFLNDMLSQETDPALRSEIIGNIAATRKNLKTDRDALIENRVNFAKTDGTRKVLEDAISKVVSAKYEANVNGNTAESELRDSQLLALKGQLETVKVNDAISSWRVTDSTRGTGASERLDFINAMAQTADLNVPVRIGNKQYNNAQEFWMEKRTGYISGADDTFGDFFSGLRDEVNRKLNSDSLTFGAPVQSTLDFVQAKLNQAAKTPGVEAFVDRLDAVRAEVLTPAVSALVAKISDTASTNFDYIAGQREIENISKRYGVDVTSALTTLSNRSINDLRAAVGQGQLSEAEALSMTPQIEPVIPKVEATAAKKEEPAPAPFPINITPQPTPKSTFPETEQPKEPIPPMVVEPNQPNKPPLTGANPPTLVTIRRKNATTGQEETNQVYESDVEHWKTQGWSN